MANSRFPATLAVVTLAVVALIVVVGRFRDYYVSPFVVRSHDASKSFLSNWIATCRGRAELRAELAKLRRAVSNAPPIDTLSHRDALRARAFVEQLEEMERAEQEPNPGDPHEWLEIGRRGFSNSMVGRWSRDGTGQH